MLVAANFLENMLAGKEVIQAGQNQSMPGFLMLTQCLTNFEIKLNLI